MVSFREKFGDVLSHAWNAFTNQEESDRIRAYDRGASYGGRPDRVRTRSSDKSIISAIQNRIAIDAAAHSIQHIRQDADGNFQELMRSSLNTCLSTEANLDQGARAFKQDMVATMLDKGTIAIVAVDTGDDPQKNEEAGGFEVKSMRVGEIVGWFPGHVRVNLYNERNGKREEITQLKRITGIAENPLYSVMNEPNSTLQRLIRKLALLDSIDEQLGSGKLDMIIQLPYVIKTEQRREEAEKRRKDIQDQMKDSQYGVAYTDGTEKITQLNRPLENNMLKQIEMLTEMVYSQLGLTKEVFNGTASEMVMMNYYNRTLEPVLTAITEAMQRSFLSKTARTQGHAIKAYRDPFKSVSLKDIASMADAMSRNQIMSANEIRAAIGLKPSADASANELRNKNLPVDQTVAPTEEYVEPEVDPATGEPYYEPEVS
jgi:hypothetical protein